MVFLKRCAGFMIDVLINLFLTYGYVTITSGLNFSAQVDMYYFMAPVMILAFVFISLFYYVLSELVMGMSPGDMLIFGAGKEQEETDNMEKNDSDKHESESKVKKHPSAM